MTETEAWWYSKADRKMILRSGWNKNPKDEPVQKLPKKQGDKQNLGQPKPIPWPH